MALGNLLKEVLPLSDLLGVLSMVLVLGQNLKSSSKKDDSESLENFRLLENSYSSF